MSDAYDIDIFSGKSLSNIVDCCVACCCGQDSFSSGDGLPKRLFGTCQDVTGLGEAQHLQEPAPPPTPTRGTP